MPLISRFLQTLPVKRAEALPSVLVVTSNAALDDESCSHIKGVFDMNGIRVDLCIRIRLESDLQLIAKRARSRHVDSHDHRVFVLGGVESTARPVLSALVSLVDKTVCTSRYVIVVPSADVVDARLRSRGILVTVPPSSDKSQRLCRLESCVHGLYDKIRVSARKRRRLDVTSRSTLNCLVNTLIDLDLRVQDVYRSFGRHGARCGDLWVVRIAASYAHRSLLSPQNELIVLQAFVLEMQARFELTLDDCPVLI